MAAEMSLPKPILCLLAGLSGLMLWGDPRLPGGETTVFDASREAFTQPAANLDPRSLARFFSGDTVFNANWVSASSVVNGRDGLGPLFNTRSCSSCHFKDGRGRPPEDDAIADGFLIRISLPGTQDNGAPIPHPRYGNQISVRALDGLSPEARVRIRYREIEGRYPDGTLYRIHKPEYSFSDWSHGSPDEEWLYSPRVAQSVFGLGLLDAIPESELLARADPEDRDGNGISGRPNWVWSASQRSRQLGKYGWKANKANLRDQAAGAFQGDIGITSSLFPSENHNSGQVDSGKYPNGGSPELDNRDLDDVVFYLETLAPPASRIENRDAYAKGEALFRQIQCAACHHPEYQTRADAPIAALAGQTIRPFTDLLLHDMGEELADHRPDFQADGREWRTPPLWGVGLIEKVNKHTRLLHDGRANGVEEAILWHGGEAEPSKQAFMALPATQRQRLIDFVNSL